MVWVGRDFKVYLVPTSLLWQEHLLLDQAAQSRIQPGLEHLQGEGTESFYGQPVPVSHHPQYSIT